MGGKFTFSNQLRVLLLTWVFGGWIRRGLLGIRNWGRFVDEILLLDDGVAMGSFQDVYDGLGLHRLVIEIFAFYKLRIM